ncbi:MAG TPA: helix-turn-helix domain-containing protein [Acidimicrobiales bacterium]|nr:helix-turn-helix domain-containing protein [Acidimicrobiales bacterium]
MTLTASDGVRSEERATRQRQARALGDPTRFAIFCFVLDASEPVRIAVLTDHFGLNHNAIRQHVAKLVDAGLLEEGLAPRDGPGRPALQYRVSPEVAAAWEADSPYRQLALLLVEVARGDGSPAEVGAAAGRRIAVSGDDQEPLARLTEEMARRGFQPRAVPRARGIDVVLDNCPFEAAAAAAPEIVCTLHRGLAEGMLEVLGNEYMVESLVARAPTRAGCRIRVRPAADRTSTP